MRVADSGDYQKARGQAAVGALGTSERIGGVLFGLPDFCSLARSDRELPFGKRTFVRLSAGSQCAGSEQGHSQLM